MTSTPRLDAGRLLVASPRLIDPNFQQTVILLCEHNDEGSMGLVINRPLELSIRELIHGIEESEGGVGPTSVSEQPVFLEGPVLLGGPVDHGRLLAVRHVMTLDPWEQDHALLEGVFLVNDVRTALRKISRGEMSAAHYRFILGYSGWGEGQLQDELGEDWWVVAQATPKLIFGTSPQAMWSAAIRDTAGPEVDPSVN